MVAPNHKLTGNLDDITNSSQQHKTKNKTNKFLTMENNKPFVWQMIKEAVENLSGRATYAEIKRYIKDKWDIDELRYIFINKRINRYNARLYCA